MAFDAVVGPPGTGKSYFMVHKGLERWANGYKKARERHHKLLKLVKIKKEVPLSKIMPPIESYQGLCANFDFNLLAVIQYLVQRQKVDYREAVVLAASIKTVRSIQELIDCWNCILLFDEAQLWFNSRNFQYFPDEVLSFWTQHRKSGIYGMLATQRYEMVDTNIRGVIANVYRAMPLPWSVRLARMVSARVYGDTAYPMFRYSTVLDESEARMSTKRSSIAEAVGKNEVVTLDPLVALCYSTSGQFYTPSTELLDAGGAAKSKIRQALGLKYDLTKFRNNKRGYVSVDLPLPVHLLADCYLRGVSVAVAVDEYQKQQYEAVTIRARAPLDAGAGGAAGVVGVRWSGRATISN